MQDFQWTDAMSVGVPALDADHRCLFRIISVLQDIKDCDDLEEVIHDVLATLELYGRNHFRREEAVMAAIEFPELGFHRSEHVGFGRSVEAFQRAARHEADPRLAATVFEYLTNWLRHHILIQDMAFKPYVRNARDAEQVARSAAPRLPDAPVGMPVV